MTMPLHSAECYYITNIVGIAHNCILGAAEFCVDLKTNVNII